MSRLHTNRRGRPGRQFGSILAQRKVQGECAGRGIAKSVQTIEPCGPLAERVDQQHAHAQVSPEGEASFDRILKQRRSQAVPLFGAQDAQARKPCSRNRIPWEPATICRLQFSQRDLRSGKRVEAEDPGRIPAIDQNLRRGDPIPKMLAGQLLQIAVQG